MCILLLVNISSKMISRMNQIKSKFVQNLFRQNKNLKSDIKHPSIHQLHTHINRLVRVLSWSNVSHVRKLEWEQRTHTSSGGTNTETLWWKSTVGHVPIKWLTFYWNVVVTTTIPLRCFSRLRPLLVWQQLAESRWLIGPGHLFPVAEGPGCPLDGGGGGAK